MNRQQEFDDWLDDVLPDLPPADVRAYCFNIFELTNGFAVQVIGAPAYEAASNNWPCDETWTSHPVDFSLPHSEFGTDWRAVESIVVQLVRKFLHNQYTSKARLLQESDAVAVGFIDGDLITVWPEATT